MLRLHNNGFTILSLALRIKYAELVRMMINYVRIKTPDVICNLKIAVHSVYLHCSFLIFIQLLWSLEVWEEICTAAVGNSSIYNLKGSADN
ncbi:hypothetical protein FRX31_028942 [Thalictrum thalictroides]|uniref:Uncharacterized protein n=1 Tax=Thalictrum thalictroides TaxID=46969 RepID=A0A7J6VA52_THATH|nr:hypothetical protein FRX31_028942 [Thalictrum thalictroides]